MKTIFKWTKKQEELLKVLASDATHCAARGGSRSGKTFAFVAAIVTRALKAPGSRHAVLRYRFNAVKSAIIFDTFPKVMQTRFPDIKYKLDKSNWFTELPNGAQIWFGGLDDKERTEKILGQEYATIFLNECSQIPWNSRNIAVTRLAQNVMSAHRDGERPLPLKLYYDYNPPSKAHWTYQIFEAKRDPDTKQVLPEPGNFQAVKINPKDNEENLPKEYIKMLAQLPARQRKRFLDGEYADANDSALWTIESIEKARETTLPDLTRVVVAVDPSGADDDPDTNNDEIGIVVAAMTIEGFAVVLYDYTMKGSPGKWGKVVADTFDNVSADLVIGEINYGGAMVEHVIQTARPDTPFKAITASRGKHVRAEPIAALFETGKARLGGTFPELEDEMCAMATHGYTGPRSPNRLDAMVFALTELFPQLASKPVSKLERKPLPRLIHGGAGWMAN